LRQFIIFFEEIVLTYRVNLEIADRSWFARKKPDQLELL